MDFVHVMDARAVNIFAATKSAKEALKLPEGQLEAVDKAFSRPTGSRLAIGKLLSFPAFKTFSFKFNFFPFLPELCYTTLVRCIAPAVCGSA